jgi:hypothetical protein
MNPRRFLFRLCNLDAEESLQWISKQAVVVCLQFRGQPWKVLYLFCLAVVYFTCSLCHVMKCNLENRHLSTELSESVAWNVIMCREVKSGERIGILKKRQAIYCLFKTCSSGSWCVREKGRKRRSSRKQWRCRNTWDWNIVPSKLPKLCCWM